MKENISLESETQGTVTNKLNDYLVKAFINDSRQVKNKDLLPLLVTNNSEKKQKVIDVIKKLLLECYEFYFSVAFITESGLILLKQTLDELKSKEKSLNIKIKGRILTTDYLTFTEPKALIWLKENTDFEIKIYKTRDHENDGGFHTKGYFFKVKENDKDITKIVIGSSNLTDFAMSKNEEWNTLLVSGENGEFLKESNIEFERLWKKTVSLDSYIDDYQKFYKENRQKLEFFENKHNYKEEITPNEMQNKFLLNLEKSLQKDEHRGLLISATGTGKTFAAAFAAKRFLDKGKKVLLIVHNETILKQDIEAFKRVLKKELRFGVIANNTKGNIAKNINSECDNLNDFDVIFSMKELISNKLEKFSPTNFDLIIIDEAHKSASSLYRKIIDYFKPQFLLGMTATPERTDDPELVFDLYDYNVLLEVRLKDALEFDYLCPFHYYGITEILDIDDKTYEDKDFNRIYCEERVDYILEKSRYYGYSGDRLHGLIFVSDKEDGRFLEKKLCEKKLKVKFLCGKNSEKERVEAIKLLEKP